jgi:hypothetical protein
MEAVPTNWMPDYSSKMEISYNHTRSIDHSHKQRPYELVVPNLYTQEEVNALYSGHIDILTNAPLTAPSVDWYRNRRDYWLTVKKESDKLFNQIQTLRANLKMPGLMRKNRAELKRIVVDDMIYEKAYQHTARVEAWFVQGQFHPEDRTNPFFEDEHKIFRNKFTGNMVDQNSQAYRQKTSR